MMWQGACRRLLKHRPLCAVPLLIPLHEETTLLLKHQSVVNILHSNSYMLAIASIEYQLDQTDVKSSLPLP